MMGDGVSLQEKYQKLATEFAKVCQTSAIILSLYMIILIYLFATLSELVI